MPPHTRPQAERLAAARQPCARLLTATVRPGPARKSKGLDILLGQADTYLHTLNAATRTSGSKFTLPDRRRSRIRRARLAMGPAMPSSRTGRRRYSKISRTDSPRPRSAHSTGLRTGSDRVRAGGPATRSRPRADLAPGHRLGQPATAQFRRPRPAERTGPRASSTDQLSASHPRPAGRAQAPGTADGVRDPEHPRRVGKAVERSARHNGRSTATSRGPTRCPGADAPPAPSARLNAVLHGGVIRSISNECRTMTACATR